MPRSGTIRYECCLRSSLVAVFAMWRGLRTLTATFRPVPGIITTDFIALNVALWGLIGFTGGRGG